MASQHIHPDGSSDQDDHKRSRCYSSYTLALDRSLSSRRHPGAGSEMIKNFAWPILVGVSCVVGVICAEVWHRLYIRRMTKEQERNALLAEYLDKQIWQFLSVDEWLERAPRLPQIR